jgi:hypothetical protein
MDSQESDKTQHETTFCEPDHSAAEQIESSKAQAAEEKIPSSTDADSSFLSILLEEQLAQLSLGEKGREHVAPAQTTLTSTRLPASSSRLYSLSHFYHDK